MNAEVAIAAASVLALCVDDNVANQQLVIGKGGMTVLYNVLRFCLLWARSVDACLHGKSYSPKGGAGEALAEKESEGLQRMGYEAEQARTSELLDPEMYLEFDRFTVCRVMENVATALSNLAFRNTACQDEMRRNGTLALCISALCGRVNGSGGSFEGLKAVADMIARQQNSHWQK